MNRTRIVFVLIMKGNGYECFLMRAIRYKNKGLPVLSIIAKYPHIAIRQYDEWECKSGDQTIPDHISLNVEMLLPQIGVHKCASRIIHS